MKRILFATILLLSNVLASFAGNWERKYMADEFGDPDYSNLCFISSFDPQGGYGASVNLIFSNGVFGMEFTDAFVNLRYFRGMKI